MGRTALGGLTRQRVFDALEAVLDPHMKVSLREMGMLHRVEVGEDGCVEVGITFPCIGCPAFDLIQADIKRAVSALEGSRTVRVKVDWDAKWRREDMADSARERARTHGYSI